MQQLPVFHTWLQTMTGVEYSYKHSGSLMAVQANQRMLNGLAAVNDSSQIGYKQQTRFIQSAATLVKSGLLQLSIKLRAILN